MQLIMNEVETKLNESLTNNSNLNTMMEVESPSIKLDISEKPSDVAVTEMLNGLKEESSTTVTEENETIGENKTIRKNETIRENETIGENKTIGKNETIGENQTIRENETIGENKTIGKNETEKMDVDLVETSPCAQKPGDKPVMDDVMVIIADLDNMPSIGNLESELPKTGDVPSTVESANEPPSNGVPSIKEDEIESPSDDVPSTIESPSEQFSDILSTTESVRKSFIDNKSTIVSAKDPPCDDITLTIECAKELDTVDIVNESASIVNVSESHVDPPSEEDTDSKSVHLDVEPTTIDTINDASLSSVDKETSLSNIHDDISMTKEDRLDVNSMDFEEGTQKEVSENNSHISVEKENLETNCKEMECDKPDNEILEFTENLIKVEKDAFVPKPDSLGDTSVEMVTVDGIKTEKETDPQNQSMDKNDFIQNSTQNGDIISNKQSKDIDTSKADNEKNKDDKMSKINEKIEVKNGSQESNTDSDKKLSTVFDTFDLLLSDDDAETNNKSVSGDKTIKSEKNADKSTCVSIDDDDDIFLIDEDNSTSISKEGNANSNNAIDSTKGSDSHHKPNELVSSSLLNKEKDGTVNSDINSTNSSIKNISSNLNEPIICPLKIMKKIRPTLGQMTREDLEEFCIVKIVESISGRSAISDLRLKLKSHEKSMEEWRKKVISLNKQNRDLQIVLKTVCEEQHKKIKENPMPIKITRSVGLQVGFPSVKSSPNSTNPTNVPSKSSEPVISTPPQPPAASAIKCAKRGRSTKAPTQINPQPQTSSPATPQSSTMKTTVKKNTIPVPRLIPATSTPTVNSPKPGRTSTPTTPTPTASNPSMLKAALSQPFSPETSTTPKPTAEKRPAIQSIDLTDDEPPAKQPALRPQPRTPQTTLRPINPQQLANTNRLTTYVVNSAPVSGGPRQVFIPISAQGQANVHSGSVMVQRKPMAAKVSLPTLRPFQSAAQPIRIAPIRPTGVQFQHPAPLPPSINTKNQMHPSWKWIPPRPTLKIAKVDNGIVISWEMDDFSESQHEAIASYQIYAYQEASVHPTTELWKKIGDVKALPLPMACTLTHFMAGFKYYFAVRALDVRSRVGPFSAPGQITLVNNKK